MTSNQQVVRALKTTCDRVANNPRRQVSSPPSAFRRNPDIQTRPRRPRQDPDGPDSAPDLDPQVPGGTLTVATYWLRGCYQDVRRSRSLRRLLGASLRRQRTFKFQNSGRQAASVFCAFGYAAQSFACRSDACPAQSSNRTQHLAQHDKLQRVQSRSRTSNSARGCRRWHLQQSRMAPCKSSWTSPLRRCSVHTQTVHAM